MFGMKGDRYRFKECDGYSPQKSAPGSTTVKKLFNGEQTDTAS